MEEIRRKYQLLRGDMVARVKRDEEELITISELDFLMGKDEYDLLCKDSEFWKRDSVQSAQDQIDEDYIQLIEYQDHPDIFMEDVTGFIPWTCPDADDQLDIIYAIRDHPRVTVKSGNGVGKTAIAAQIAIWFLYCFHPSIVVTTAPTTRQVEKILWGEIRQAYKSSKIELGGELLNTEIRIEDKWYAIGFATDEPDRFHGFHAPYVLIVCDEASGIPENIFAAMEGILTSANVRLLLIGNPTNPSSYFGRTFLHPRDSEGWIKLTINCWNSPNVRNGENLVPALCSKDWPEKKRKQWGIYNPFYQVRVTGEFPESGEDIFVPYHMVHSALEITIKPAGKKILSVDVARFGGDQSVISRLWGSQFRILRKIRKQDGVDLANKIVKVVREEKGENPVEEIKVDVIGWGASCYDELRRMKRDGKKEEKELLKNIKIIAVNVSEKPRSSKARKDYKNIRSESAYSIRTMFEEDMVDIEDEDLGVQLCNILYDFKEGKYTLERKKDFKKRYGDSPDELDSLIIAKAITRGGVPMVR